MKVHTKFIQAFGALLIAALLFAALPAGEVKAQTDPVHNVTQSLYYDTIHEAVDEAKPGDEIVVEKGEYIEDIKMMVPVTLVGADSENPPTIIGEILIDHINPGESPTMIKGINFRTREDYKHKTISIVSATGVEIVNCNFDGAGKFMKDGDVAIQMSSTVEKVTIVDSHITNGFYVAIQGYMNGVTIQNTVIDKVKSAINAQYGTGLHVENTEIVVIAQSPANDTYGIRFGSDTGTANNLTVVGGSIAVEEEGYTPDEGIYHSAIVLRKAASGTLSIEDAKIFDDVVNNSGNRFEASPNWWHNPDGPAPGEVIGDVNVNPWYNTYELTTKTYLVCADQPFTTIQSAINAAASGDTIKICAGEYVEDAVLSPTLNPNKQLNFIGEVDGTGAPLPVIKGSLTIDLPFADDNWSIQNLNFVVVNNHTLKLKNVNGLTVSNCTFDGGGKFLTGGKNGINLDSSPNGNYLAVQDSHFSNGLYVAIGGYLNELAVDGCTIENVKSGLNIQGAANNQVLVDDTDISVIAQGIGSDTYGIRFASDGSNNAGKLNFTNGSISVDKNDLVAESGTFHSAIIIRSGAVGPLTVEDNVILGDVVNQSSVVLNASPNYWGSLCGPSDIEGSVDYSPWYTDASMTTTASGEIGAYIFPAGTTISYMNEMVACAAPGSTLTFEGGTYPGGLIINNPNLTFNLNGATVGPGSPAFTVNANYTKINGPGTLDGDPTDTGTPNLSNAIEVADGVIDFTLDTVEILNWADGLHFKGVITDTVIVDNFIHDNTGNAIYFGAQPAPPPANVIDIKGNMFKENDGNGIEAGTSTVPADYNSWGDVDGAAVAEGGDGISANVVADPYTHVDLYLVSTNPNVDNWRNQVFVGEQITYEVTADLRQVMGADFVLEFPDNLSVANQSVGNVFDQNRLSVTGNKIRFEGWQEGSDEGGVLVPAAPVADGQGYVLFTVTFDAISVGRDLPLNFDETTDEFSMSPGYGPSLNIYADELVDTTLDVIDPPTLAIEGLGDPFYVGVMSHEITNTICNPTTGGDWSESPDEADAIGWIRISDVNLADIASLQFLYDGVWYDFEIQDQYGGTAVYQDGSDVVARFGNYNFGFDIPLQDPQWCDIDKFRVTFTKPGTHDVTVSIYDMWDTPYDYSDDKLLVSAGPTEILVQDANFEGVGTISMQGRTERSGVPVTLLSDLYDPVTVWSMSMISNNVQFTTNGGLFTFTTLQERYLNVTADLDKYLLVDGNTTFESLELKGGNAVWDGDNTINIQDASKVSTNYNLPGFAPDADVNFDGKVSIQDLALVGGNYGLTSEVAYADWYPEADDTLPALTVVSPAEGPVVLGSSPFVWIVDAADAGDNLYELEIDHNIAGLQEFSLYASEISPYGTLAEKDLFMSQGVYVNYIASDHTWVINFGNTVTDVLVAQGNISFYVVLKDLNGNQWGTMYGTTPDNTFNYTISRS